MESCTAAEETTEPTSILLCFSENRWVALIQCVVEFQLFTGGYRLPDWRKSLSKRPAPRRELDNSLMVEMHDS